MKIFPNVDEEKAKGDPLSIQAFGKRFVSDQSLYEYLLEFLLVFSSAKEKSDESTKCTFHDVDLNQNSAIVYYANYRIALKRFILFEKSKREGQFKADKIAYEDLLALLDKKIRDEDSESHIKENIQDLFYGFSLVLKNRSWFAQALLPLSPSLIFAESMGEKKIRDKELPIEELDKKFEFGRHNFFARGGEVYYLHVLRSVTLYPEYKVDIEEGLTKLIAQTEGVTKLADYIQDVWEKENNLDKHIRECVCGYIPLGYDKRAEYTCIELKNYLQSSLNVIDKIQILGKGIILQITRMFHIQARERIENCEVPFWVIDMRSGNKNIRDYAERTYTNFNEDIIEALHVGLKNVDCIKARLNELVKNEKKKKALDDKKELEKILMNEGGEESYKVVKKLGKEIKLIIPANGAYERFSLSEDLVKFLVLSLVEPRSKITIEHFMELLFEHYGMVIGRKHMHLYCKQKNIDESEASYFEDNEKAFKQFLSNCGFLRELSDATAIVFNPYERE